MTGQPGDVPEAHIVPSGEHSDHFVALSGPTPDPYLMRALALSGAITVFRDEVGTE